MLELDDPWGPFQPKLFYDSVIVHSICELGRVVNITLRNSFTGKWTSKCLKLVTNEKKKKDKVEMYFMHSFHYHLKMKILETGEVYLDTSSVDPKWCITPLDPG